MFDGLLCSDIASDSVNSKRVCRRRRDSAVFESNFI